MQFVQKFQMLFLHILSMVVDGLATVDNHAIFVRVAEIALLRTYVSLRDVEISQYANGILLSYAKDVFIICTRM